MYRQKWIEMYTVLYFFQKWWGGGDAPLCPNVGSTLLTPFTAYKIQMGYHFTSNFHANLQSHSYGCLVNSPSFLLPKYKTMIY